MVQNPLVSVIVLCYNNYHYLKETLRSVIAQDYPRIQLVISDDASDYFPVDDLIQYMNEARVPRIESVIINVNESNMGTVKHLEYIRKKCKGEYIVTIAGDDVFYDSRVITNFANEMKRLGNDAEIITAQIEMWDSKLQKKYEDFVSPDDVELIKNLSPEKLFERLALKCFIPPLCFCRKSVFDKIGELSSKYKIIEDWSMHLCASRLGIKIHWLDIVSMKHRDGGISHGNRANSNEVYYAYRSDIKYLYQYEILPYLDRFSPETADSILDVYQYRIKYYDREIENLRKKEQQLKSKNSTIINKKPAQPPVQPKVKKEKISWFRKHSRLLFNTVYKFTRKEFIFATFVITLMLFITSGIMSISDKKLLNTFYVFFMCLGLLAFFTSVVMITANIVIRIRYR